jgi:hypothetical protein
MAGSNCMSGPIFYICSDLIFASNWLCIRLCIYIWLGCFGCSVSASYLAWLLCIGLLSGCSGLACPELS